MPRNDGKNRKKISEICEKFEKEGNLMFMEKRYMVIKGWRRKAQWKITAQANRAVSKQ